MEEPENDDRMNVVEGGDSSSHANKPYELGTGAEILEIPAGLGSEEKCVVATAFVESSVGVCVERDGMAALEDMLVSGEGDGESGLEGNHVAVVKPVAVAVDGGGGEIIAARSDDPPREIKVVEVTEGVGGGVDGQLDASSVEPKIDMKAEQELSPEVDAKLEMVGGGEGNVPICYDSVMDSGRDDSVNPQLTKEPEKEVARVIDSKADGVVVAGVGDEEKSYDFPMDERDGELQVTTQQDARRDDLGNPHLAVKPGEEFVAVIDSRVDVGEEEKPFDFPMDVRDCELHAAMQKEAREDGLVNPQLTMKPEEELVLVIDGEVDEGVEEKPFDSPMDARESELHEMAQVDAGRDDSVNPQLAMKREEGIVTVIDGKVDAVVTDVGDEKNSFDFPMDGREGELQEAPQVDARRDDSVNPQLAMKCEVGLAAKIDGKVDTVITGDIPIPDAATNGEIATEVHAFIANVGEQEQVHEFCGSMECAGNDMICRNAEDKEMDPAANLISGINIGEGRDMSMDVLKNSELEKPVNVEESFQERLEDAVLRGETSAGDVKKETEMGVELDSKGMVMELSLNSKLDEPVNVEESLQERLEDAAVKEEASAELIKKDKVVGVKLESKDMRTESSKNSKLDEPVNVQEHSEDAPVKEEASAGGIQKETEVGVDLDSTRNVVMEEIQPTDTQMGIDLPIDKTRDDVGSMDIEEIPSDVDEPGEGNCDSLTAPQDEEDEKMVAEEETGTQDMIMETELDIPDSGKTSGGKQKRAKVSKGPVSKVMTKASRKKEGEDVCFICFDGGELVICDRRGCPKAYHPSCVNRDEAFFKSKGRWNCGWHLCNICEKNAHHMCYTCTFSLCKSCIRDASFLCVRGNKGFCETCIRTVMLIENEQESKDTQVDFDDKNCWEYLFKDYYIELKVNLSLSPVEIEEVKNPCKGANMSGPSKQESSEAPADANDGGSCSDDPTENLESTKPKRRKVRKQSKSLVKEDESVSSRVEAGDKAIVLADNSGWASKELFEFISHVKDGDTSVLSQFDVQALLLEYVKINKLRDPRRKSQIICDARLENLFGKPRVGHFEMLKLLESHFLVRDEQNDDVQGSVVDAENNFVDPDANTDSLTRDIKERKRKYRKKGTSRGPQSNLDEYAAIDMHNIGLIYLRRKLMEDLLEDTESFHDKVIGTFVRIRISGSASKQDLYRLVQIVGTSKAPEPQKVGKKTTEIMVEILNLDKTEIISIDSVSNQEFSEEECKRLRQSIKCGLISRLTVGEILDKTMELQATRVNDWLESETMRLSHLRDRASDLGRRKELRECVEKLQRLKTPEERQRRLEEIPEIHADPKMDPNYESDDHDSKTEDSRQDAFIRSRSSSFSRRGSVPISPVTENSIKDSRTNARKVLSKTWEPSRDMSSNNFSISTGHNGEVVIENSSVGRDRGRRDSNNLAKINSAASSEPAEWSLHSVARLESSPSMTAVTPQASSWTRSGEIFVEINESEKMWHYQDPSGKVQGPFSMVQLRKWNKTGYFPADLRIWRTTENQANAILLVNALGGKIPKESPSVGNTLQTKNDLHGSLACHSSKASGTLSQERQNTDQMSGSHPTLSTEKLLRNDIASLPSPTPKHNMSGSTRVEGGIITGAIQSPSVNGVLSSPTHSSSPASVLSSVLQAVAFSSVPNSQQGSMVDSEVSLHAQTIAIIEQPPVAQTHSNPQATVHPVQNLQTNTQGWAAGAQTAQPQVHGWSSPNVQKSSESFSASCVPSGNQPDVWRPQSSQPNIHPLLAMPDASWAMGLAGNNASMGVRPDNPNISWGSVPGNMNNMGWGNPTTGNPNMNWEPAVLVPPLTGNTPGWVAPAGNTGPNLQGMVPANPNPVWAAAQNWGPPVQGQAHVPGWGIPGGNAGGPPPPALGPPQGNTNQGWVVPPRNQNQGAWNGEQNHMGGQFSGQRAGQGRDPGFNGSRPWNRQSPFHGGGGSRKKHETICPFNENGRCRKGTQCDFLHA